MAEDIPFVSGCRILDSKKMGLCRVTHINGATVFGADRLCATFHKALEPAARSELFLAKGRAHDEAWADRHNLEALSLGQSSLEVPSGLLG